MHTLQGCILLTVYRIQLFKQMTQICTQQGAFVKTVPFTEKYVCSLVCVGDCVCLPTTKHGNIVIGVALMDLFALK